MARLKTRLTPDEQWTRTVRYATRIHDDDPAIDFDGWRELHYGARSWRREVPPPEAELRARWQAVRLGRERVPARGRSWPCIALVTRPHRWLNVGDALILMGSNGMNERFAVSGVSSKGVRLRFCYLRLDHGTGQGVIETCGVPESLFGLRWADEALRAFMHECRNEHMARRGP